MRRFYSYLIYKLYTWALNGSGYNTPIFNVIVTLACVHSFQLIFLMFIAFKCLPANTHLSGWLNYVAILAILFLISHYYVFYNKERWEGYVKEFENETPKQSLKGKIYVLSYLIGSTIGVIWLMYFMSVYLFK
ncbi:hypothetical protein SAMN04488122_3410 [Chitinophaga arvensicola]|uniref:Uncharacterized protein n=1 Tax=Chitinophaga arvensicola TaxID=29529 RepID=A0A1I0RUM2_9BACT|nr:hypothetical protein SAMN04488122_3410 [Chitinophaga arvensicola]